MSDLQKPDCARNMRLVGHSAEAVDAPCDVQRRG